jgi:sterol desaturase/sphingolipid hydroxylase (fatty acid hydroxylase superfamily)
MHASAWLWRFHRVHHEPGVFWLAAWRLHPIDAALHLGVVVLATVLVQVPLASMGAVALTRRLYTALLRADVPWRTTALDRWIATPGIQHRHHADDGTFGNYAGLLAVLDRAFGTWLPGRSSAAAVAAVASAATATDAVASDRKCALTLTRTTMTTPSTTSAGMRARGNKVAITNANAA